ncbi:MAG TPA: hypothetical protein VMG41_06145 [Gemmatimonadales bacterium]|nr:hypothetical protein [Gemmatimonadales bacterium]
MSQETGRAFGEASHRRKALLGRSWPRRLIAPARRRGLIGALTDRETFMICRGCQERLWLRGLRSEAWSFAALDDVSDWRRNHRRCASPERTGAPSFDFVDELSDGPDSGAGIRLAGHPEPLTDLEALVGRALSLAESELDAAGGIEPFALALYQDNRLVVLVDNRDDSVPGAGLANTSLTRYLRARAAEGLLTAAVLCQVPDRVPPGECLDVHAERKGSSPLRHEISIEWSLPQGVSFGPRSLRPLDARDRWIQD